MTNSESSGAVSRSGGAVSPADKTPLDAVVPKTAVRVGIADPVDAARAELKAALAAIEVKANFPRRIEKASVRAVAKAKTFADRNPVGAIAGVVALAAAVGGAVWVIARVISR